MIAASSIRIENVSQGVDGHSDLLDLQVPVSSSEWVSGGIGCHCEVEMAIRSQTRV